jgi:dienelactone hydrolase
MWLLAALALAPGASAQERVEVPSLDSQAGKPIVLPGYWWAAATDAAPPGPRPAMVLLHGCGGLFETRGRAAQAQARPPTPAARYTAIAGRLNALGVHVLAVDSFSPRGETQLCTQALGTRRLTQQQRRLDALGALAWLATQAAQGVDPARLGLLGWSNGGSTVLAATDGRREEVRAAAHRASLAVAFYPGCETVLRSGYRVTAPLLLLLGAEDDWTPAAPCEALARQAGASPAIELASFEGAYHGFDGTAPLRLRRDVPNGVNPGQGVHVGAHPPAREAARARLDTFLRHHWNLP